MVPTALADRLLTAEEFMHLPDSPDGSRYELVRGVVVVTPPTQYPHGKYCFRIALLVGSHVVANGLGEMTCNDSGVVTETDPDSVRGPDVAYFSKERMPEPPKSGYPDVLPDLVAEVLSPNDRPGKVQEKVDEYLAAGVRIVWVVDPIDLSVTVHRPAEEKKVLQLGTMITGEDVLPGFSIPVAELFDIPTTK